MTAVTRDSYFTSNDLLQELREKHRRPDNNYSIIVQSADDVRDVENAPAVSMGPYLLGSEQMRLLTSISVYSSRGKTREQLRLLYMNEVALRIWREMEKLPRIIGSQIRPPREALLSFGVPFSK